MAEQKLLNASKRAPGTVSRALAPVGFIILIVIMVWGLFHAVALASPWFSSLFRHASPATPTTIVVQEPTKTALSKKPQTAVVHPRPADLRVQIIFATVDAYGNGTMQFDIANIGGSPSGMYYFKANVPTTFGYIYTSPTQTSLNPGDHIQNTLTFSPSVSGAASITVDPQNLVPEVNKTNNYASWPLQRLH